MSCAVQGAAEALEQLFEVNKPYIPAVHVNGFLLLYVDYGVI